MDLEAGGDWDAVTTEGMVRVEAEKDVASLRRTIGTQASELQAKSRKLEDAITARAQAAQELESEAVAREGLATKLRDEQASTARLRRELSALEGSLAEETEEKGAVRTRAEAMSRRLGRLGARHASHLVQRSRAAAVFARGRAHHHAVSGV